MPDTLDDNTSASSAEEKVDSAINTESNESQLETAEHDSQDSDINDNSNFGPVVKAAIKKLASGEDLKSDNSLKSQKDSGKPQPKVEEKKPNAEEVPKTDDPLKDFSDVEKKQLSQKTQRRIQELWKSGKDAEKIKESQEYKNGAWLHNLINDNQLAADAGTVADEQFIGAIKFQGKLNRLLAGNATDADKQHLAKIYNKFHDEGVKLGFLSKQDAVAEVDVAPLQTSIESAVVKLYEDYDIESFINTVKSSIAGLKAPQKKEQSQPAQSQQPHQSHDEPQSSKMDYEGVLYSKKLAKDAQFLGDEGKDLNALYNRLESMAVDNLRKEFPNTNPKEYYVNLSIRSRYELLKEQLDLIKSSREAEKQPKLNNGNRPLRDTQPAPNQPTGKLTPTQLAVQRLETWGQ